MTVRIRKDLVGSRLAPDEDLPETIRWIEIDEELRSAGGRMIPGEVALAPPFVGRLFRWRLAGLRPLVARCTVPPGTDPDEARMAALEIDALSGGTLDEIRIEERPEAPSPNDVFPTPALAVSSIPQRFERVRDPAILHRIEGAILGLAVGDSLGAPVENWPAEKISRIHGSFRDFVSGRGWGPGHPTRETTFALLWFREMANGRTVHSPEDRTRLGQALGRWVVGRPRDFGHLTRGILQGYLENPPVVAARKAFDKARRQTEFNGALTRAAAIGAALPFDSDLRWASAIAASAMTYPAAVCLGCAIAVADGVAASVRGEGNPCDAARATAWEEKTAAALEEVAGGTWAPGGGEWAGHGRGHVLRTLESAFWASRQDGTIEDVLIDLVHRGGDADTHAAVAGAILGGRTGPEGIPERWRERLRTRELIHGLISRYAGAPLDSA